MATHAPAQVPADSADAPRFPSTLAPDAYYEGLVDRLRTALLPTLDPFFSSLYSSSSPLVLELASGNGTHAALFTRTYPSLSIQPTECDSFGVKRIDQTVAREGAERVRAAVKVDVMSEGDWEGLGRKLREEEGEGKRYDLVFGSNFLHMVPFPDAPQRIFRRLLAHSLLTPSAKVLIYGPFKSDTGFFSRSDESFNEAIAARPSPYPLGLRSIDALARIAREEGWKLSERIGVAKGNWVLVFEQEREGK
ncbi:hypothetical protein NBRC10512_006612 [Rhodotorula toruloides]|uniref:RHTO0S10e04764g1_1 n=2 Tax=Rhodotorula toruloides TaxID=5286 RepID=A0A061BDP0_RHOTO|nr:protein of unknown function DUF938 [Rhodotorula toruloides NP11]EMS22791.1 protein of unknown function DUF938 [Rhodotorula toruloides NP11]KAJ8293096.1 Methyltransferase-like 26 [Rhodotorula toruloides]CDR45069.1 RHTO0S10e04764g1_1 [Rhodotorula toruloides]